MSVVLRYLGIALLAITIATMAVAYQTTGKITFETMLLAQRSNVAIWMLNLSPLIFMFLGQSMSSSMSLTASTMVIDQTNELRQQTKELQSKMLYESSHDLLTDLPNRILFQDRLNRELNSHSTHNNKKLAVIIVNINNFRDLNAGFGNYNADRLLKQFASRLKNSVREPVTVARLNSDEFAILFPEIESEHHVQDYIVSLNKALAENFILDGADISIHSSAGIVFYPHHGRDADTLLQRANVAMYFAKNHRKDHAIYDFKMDKEAPNKIILMSELKRAIESEQLQIYYQPIFDIESGYINGAEALVRWDHPNFGMMDAQKFIPVAERTGLIKSLTQFVIREVIIQVANWIKQDIHIQVSINLSAVDIVDIELPFSINSLLKMYDVPAKYIKLELIESAYLSDQDRAKEVISKLAELGIQIAIDDFGTGYSSFIYLTNLPVNEVKIDRGFVMHMADDPKKYNIVHAIIKLAEALELSVVAEGICNREILEQLKQLSCQRGQGFLFSKAVPALEFEEMVNDPRPLPTMSELTQQQPHNINDKSLN